jgi:hypothetical protein
MLRITENGATILIVNFVICWTDLIAVESGRKNFFK